MSVRVMIEERFLNSKSLSPESANARANAEFKVVLPSAYCLLLTAYSYRHRHETLYTLASSSR